MGKGRQRMKKMGGTGRRDTHSHKEPQRQMQRWRWDRETETKMETEKYKETETNSDGQRQSWRGGERLREMGPTPRDHHDPKSSHTSPPTGPKSALHVGCIPSPSTK